GPARSGPPAPTGLKAPPGDGRVALSWNAAGGATGYNVYRGTASGSEALLQSGVTGTTFTDTGLANGTTYFYRVSGVNAAGEGPQSAEVSATPRVAAPTNLTATAVSPDQIDLTWTDNSAAETGFVVEWAADSAFTAGFTSVSLGADTTAYSATGLTAITT